MIVRNLRELDDTERDVVHHTWRSRRFLLASDRIGFSLHDTVLYAGTETPMWYSNHVEAVYCVGGEGELVNDETGEVFPLSDGTMYVLNGHEHHRVRARTDLRTVCVFNPPCTGREVHDADGSYPLLIDDAEGESAAAAVPS